MRIDDKKEELYFRAFFFINSQWSLSDGFFKDKAEARNGMSTIGAKDFKWPVETDPQGYCIVPDEEAVEAAL